MGQRRPAIHFDILGSPIRLWRTPARGAGAEDKRHREDGPSWESGGGARRWYRDGLLHRERGPCVVREDGSEAFHLLPNNHRKD